MAIKAIYYLNPQGLFEAQLCWSEHTSVLSEKIMFSKKVKFRPGQCGAVVRVSTYAQKGHGFNSQTRAWVVGFILAPVGCL